MFIAKSELFYKINKIFIQCQYISLFNKIYIIINIYLNLINSAFAFSAPYN